MKSKLLFHWLLPVYRMKLLALESESLITLWLVNVKNRARYNWRVYYLQWQKEPLMVSESNFSTLICLCIKCFIIWPLPSFPASCPVSPTSFCLHPYTHAHTHISPSLSPYTHTQTHQTPSKLSFPDHCLEWMNILFILFLLHSSICWLPTRPSCVSHIPSQAGSPPCYCSVFVTPLAMHVCTHVSCSVASDSVRPH